MSPREKHIPHLLEVLSQADQSFADTGDRLEALGWVALALRSGLPVPPRIARWLRDAILAYISSQADSLDAALGLVARGKASPRRKRREQFALQGALARMHVLHALGATIEQAATMVAKLQPEHSIATLADRYKRSGTGREALRERPLLLQRWHWREVETVLAEYPDRPVAAKLGKERIRKMYAKRRI